MPQKKESNAPVVSSKGISSSRLINAPVELVWKAWREPGHIKNWWGPEGFTNTISKMEVKEGGEWIFIMHGPDGTDYKNKHIYKEIIPNKKLVLEHVSAPHFVMTVMFEAKGEQTLLHIHSGFESEEQLKQVIKVFKADEGLKQNIDRLENYLLN